MIANVRRRRDSSTTGFAVTSFDATDDLMSGDVAPRGEALGAVVAGDGQLHGDPQAGPFARGELLVLEDQLAGVGVVVAPQAGLEAGDVLLAPPLGERRTPVVEALDQLDHRR